MSRPHGAGSRGGSSLFPVTSASSRLLSSRSLAGLTLSPGARRELLALLRGVCRLLPRAEEEGLSVRDHGRSLTLDLLFS
ncbi:unnamed protein product [Pleuronectes platessa]|uniref:Uncharacterized protein n=1 Tax=Pleuronectes platessa TaxID=8262 RepID=A0A9N7VQ65_PLEPL|nr:unnamed protein product [Pleuronectes platessa]